MIIYIIGDGQAEVRAEMKNLLGGKGANLAEMTSTGLPVPPGVDTLNVSGLFQYKIFFSRIISKLNGFIESDHELHLPPL
jgi:phosphoenolpyruvate synthase/pyruvate phosphate dikinase